MTTSFRFCLKFAHNSGNCECFAFRNARFLFLMSCLIDEFINVGSAGLILDIYLVNIILSFPVFFQ